MIIPPSTIIDATISHDRRTIWARIGNLGVKFFISNYIIESKELLRKEVSIIWLIPQF
jgi:hypothetical protein